MLTERTPTPLGLQRKTHPKLLIYKLISSYKYRKKTHVYMTCEICSYWGEKEDLKAIIVYLKIIYW